ncbi:MAG TPA: hypothetical protein VNC78_06650 [Actinomycetota bacterium]|nr:hypothetical protein [Actinomycetota bacterium]
MEAQITGTQRKVFGAWVAPTRLSDGAEGIALAEGRTLPFVVRRSWSAPAGVYPESWYLVHPDTNEVLHESDSGDVRVFGLQSLTEFKTEVVAPIALPPGSYLVVFALGGIRGGELEVKAT